jgi:hypothetical protein
MCLINTLFLYSPFLPSYSIICFFISFSSSLTLRLHFFFLLHIGRTLLFHPFYSLVSYMATVLVTIFRNCSNFSNLFKLKSYCYCQRRNLHNPHPITDFESAFHTQMNVTDNPSNSLTDIRYKSNIFPYSCRFRLLASFFLHPLLSVCVFLPPVSTRLFLKEAPVKLSSR